MRRFRTQPGKARRPRRAAPRRLSRTTGSGSGEPAWGGIARHGLTSGTAFWVSGLLALLLTLSLPLSAFPAAPARAAETTAAVCKHCSCGMSGCCVDDPQPAPSQAPTAPAPRTTSSQELAGILARTLVLLPALTATPREHFRSFSASSFPGAVPLHARYCCFLI